MYDNPYTRLLLDTKMRCEFTSQIQEPTLLGAVGRGPRAVVTSQTSVCWAKAIAARFGF